LSPSRVLQLEREGKLDLQGHFDENRVKFFLKGIRTIEQLVDRMQVDYRNLPKEKRADDFAVNIIRANWGKLGFDKIAHLG